MRVPVPALTEERRKTLVKQAHEKAEEARIALRTIRQDAIKEARRLKDAKELSEDDTKRIETAFDDEISKHNAAATISLKPKSKIF